MTNEYKTLRELDVKPGDVVESMAGNREVVSCSRHAVCLMKSGATWKFYNPIWRIVSRASDTPKLWREGGMKLEEGKYYRTADGKKVGPVRIAETHIPDKWALWSFEGKIYEVVGLPREDAFDTEIIAEEVDHYYVFNRSEFSPKLWRDMTPEEKGALLLAKHEGKVIECFHEGEWVNIYKPPWVGGVAYRVKPEEKRETFHMYGHNQYFGFYQCPFHTHRITFDLVDGEPDPSSIKMEKTKQ